MYQALPLLSGESLGTRLLAHQMLCELVPGMHRVTMEDYGTRIVVNDSTHLPWRGGVPCVAQRALADGWSESA